MIDKVKLLGISTSIIMVANLILFIFGLLVPMINNWGHGGGIAAGIGLGFLLGYQENKKENILHKLLAGGCAGLTLLILGWVVLSGIYYRFIA